jgi:AcrR family transcriptional regulator
MPPRSDVSAERRAQIIQAAIACFLRKGYHNTTMDDIVAESGLSKGSLYWYFKSKDELFAEALMSVFTDIGQEAFAALEQCTTASDKLCALAQSMVALGKEAEGLFNLFIEFWASSPRREEVGQLWSDMLVQYKGLIVEIVEEGIKSGEFKPVGAGQLAWALMAAYDALAAYAMLMPDIDLDRVSQVFVETLLRGLQNGTERDESQT